MQVFVTIALLLGAAFVLGNIFEAILWIHEKVCPPEDKE